MFLTHLPTVLLALCSITSVVSARAVGQLVQPRNLVGQLVEPRNRHLESRDLIQPFAGRQGYTAETETDETGTRWGFSIYADGYTEEDEDGNQLPVDTMMVNTATGRLTVMKAMNGDDKTPNRLKMREVLAECWRLAGMKPADLKEVLGYMISNKNMKDAIAVCRSGMGLAAAESFEVTNAETDLARKACWTELGKTIFSSAIKGAIVSSEIDKSVTKVSIDNGGDWDHVYYEFT